MILFKLVINYIHSGGEVNVFWWSISILAYIGFVISDACFNVGTWCLAFNYFVCSEKLEEVNNNQTPSRKTSACKEKCHNVIFWFMLVLNICSATAWGTFRFIKNYDKYKGYEFTMQDAEFAS